MHPMQTSVFLVPCWTLFQKYLDARFFMQTSYAGAMGIVLPGALMVALGSGILARRVRSATDAVGGGSVTASAAARLSKIESRVESQQATLNEVAEVRPCSCAAQHSTACQHCRNIRAGTSGGASFHRSARHAQLFECAPSGGTRCKPCSDWRSKGPPLQRSSRPCRRREIRRG